MNTVRAIEVDRAELLDVVRDATSVGASLWIRIRGGSMNPAIPTGAEVRVTAVAAHQLRIGDVVLARATDGQPVLHRVRSIDAGRVQLKGDNLSGPDDPLAVDEIIAIADAVRVDGTVTPIPAEPRALHKRAMRRVRHIWRRLANG